MMISLILHLRRQGIPVGTQELITLAQALARGLHRHSLDEFYYIARAILIHDEAHLDDFDQIFAHVLRGVPWVAKTLLQDLENWLKDPKERPQLSEEERSALQEIDLVSLKKMYEERLKEQTERHDGGSYWIGTGGRSPFGTQGIHPSGISLSQGRKPPGGGGRSVLSLADARKFQSYRSDLILDVRQMEVALRKLRHFDRSGPPAELDLEKSIDATAKNFGELEVVLKKPRHPNTRVILMMDVGGSMDPFTLLVSQLFSAAKRATHWKELRTYYFHNCVYGRLYPTHDLRDPILVRDLLRECDSRYKLIWVGDAAMAPYELMGSSWTLESTTDQKRSGIDWLLELRQHFPDSIWLNPDLSPWGSSTQDTIARIFPMFPLTLQGLEEALQELS